ncbi:MAG TPA: signal peptidase I [Acidimicrobiales bacterium]|nr:signal peptidase I [Acidimicrobiales bacterium]
MGVQTAGEAPARLGPKDRRHRRRRRQLLVRWALVLTAVTVVALLLRASVVAPFAVPSSAMVPTLQVGDRILVVKSTILAGSVERGDVVVFRRPKVFPCGADNGGQDLVKRVIGLPGETIWSAGQTVDVDGRRLKEPGWYNAKSGEVGSTPIHRTRIPPGHYFVLGDNRTDSCDSRSFGAIPGSAIVGRVMVIVTRDGHPYLHLL